MHVTHLHAFTHASSFFIKIRDVCMLIVFEQGRNDTQLYSICVLRWSSADEKIWDRRSGEEVWDEERVFTASGALLRLNSMLCRCANTKHC